MGVLGANGSMTDLSHSVRLLSAQMKLQMNSSMLEWGPGDQLKFAKQSFHIIQQCSTTDYSVRSDCLNIIQQYIRILNDTNKKFSDRNQRPRQSSIMLHKFFLSDLHLWDQDWVQHLMEIYPYAFIYVGEEWSAWTAILH